MSFPDPPGAQRRFSSIHSSPSSLPPRSPAPAGGLGFGAFTAFQPRSVATTQPFRSVATPAPPGSVSASPVPYTTSPGYPYAPTAAAPGQGPYGGAMYGAGGSFYDAQPQYDYGAGYGAATPAAAAASAPQIVNPFPAPIAGGQYGKDQMDPETEAQIAQWQSAYTSRGDDQLVATRRDLPGNNKNSGGSSGAGAQKVYESGASVAVGAANDAKNGQKAKPTVVRSGGGQTWTDPTLLEWDPSHFRLFVGNLAGEVTNDSLLKAFSRYNSVQKARVIRDKRTEKSRGYGFVSFSDGDDYFRAAREMQGKYIGSHPVLLRRATTEIKPTTKVPGARGKKNQGGGNGGKADKERNDRVHKKQPKTKAGLKVLG